MKKFYNIGVCAVIAMVFIIGKYQPLVFMKKHKMKTL